MDPRNCAEFASPMWTVVADGLDALNAGSRSEGMALVRARFHAVLRKLAFRRRSAARR